MDDHLKLMLINVCVCVYLGITGSLKYKVHSVKTALSFVSTETKLRVTEGPFCFECAFGNRGHNLKTGLSPNVVLQSTKYLVFQYLV